MSNDRYISAAEIGNYTFCPRSWALSGLGYKSDNQWELEKGIEYHKEIGQQEIKNNFESQPKQITIKRQIKVLRISITILAIIIFSILVRIILK